MSWSHSSQPQLEAADPIGPLVPMAPIFALAIALRNVARETTGTPESAAAAALTAWIFAQLHAVLDGIAHEMIPLAQAAREVGLTVDACRAELRHDGVDVREEDEVDVERALIWMLASDAQPRLQRRASLIPMRPFWDLRRCWQEELHARDGDPDGISEFVQQRRLGIALLDEVLDAIAAERVTLAQAGRETGAPPDELLGYLRHGQLEVEGDPRSPRIRRGAFLTPRFQQRLAGPSAR